MWNTYCKKHHPVLAKGNGASHTWRKMLEITEEVEHDIWWQVKSGEASFWLDNWMKQGALYYIQEHNGEEEVEVRQFIVNGEWESCKLIELLSEEITNHILENISPRVKDDTIDTSWWMGQSCGAFTVKSTHECMRHKKEKSWWWSKIWTRGMPFKINYFLWWSWKGIIPTEYNLKKMRISMASRCYCCNSYEQETIHYLFLRAPIATKLWKQFASCVGIKIEGGLQ
ncbi:hypothetical protein R3W88_014844 [Solanum pinnatisectum]|uniref:Reverse transcriptase zinc-binding domain-containing protein n=1 Tax=Solanum pinnatisectum TaxID=50273 RepID=A0AAV9KTE3_9SOLN|nr:hypothetical protein R3W88_014844 [Solanum pinnatisectum]